jgi:hypothetical protein
MNDYIFYSQDLLDKFSHDKLDTSNLFNSKNSLDQWVSNKLVNYSSKENMRLIVSSYELVDTMHQAGANREVIFNRYKGIRSQPTERLIKYRDGVDMNENFDKAKYSIKNSMQKTPDPWRKNLDNHMHLLLYKASKKIKNSDPLYKTRNFKTKSFYTTWSAYIHHKREITILESNSLYEGVSNGGIPEVSMEPNMEFYQELKVYWSNYKENVMKFTEISKKYEVNTNIDLLEVQFKNYFSDFEEAVDICIKAVEIQEDGKEDAEFNNEILRKLIYYEEEVKSWVGWYSSIFNKQNRNRTFALDFWVEEAFTAGKAEKLKFPGIVIYNTLKYPQIGLVVVKDKISNKDKIMLYSSYDSIDFLMELKEKIYFEDVAKKIAERDV